MEEEIKRLKEELRSSRNRNVVLEQTYKNYKIINDILIEREIKRVDDKIFN